MKPTRFETDQVASRIQTDIDRLAKPPFTSEGLGVTRYGFTPAYRSTVDHVARLAEGAGMNVGRDPVGNLIARTTTSGTAVGLGSHLDSVRHGGRWDGTLGVLVACEVARLNTERKLGLSLRAISWVEEEGSGFGEMLLGSRIATGDVSADDLRSSIISVDDGRSFAEHCAEAGGAPEHAAETAGVIGELDAWVEVHIEQGRVLEAAGVRLGIVDAIGGYVHGDITFSGQADHAGTTPMELRADAAVVAAEAIVAAEAAARRSSTPVVATAGEVEVSPGVINVVPGAARITIDVRSSDGGAIDAVLAELDSAVKTASAERGVTYVFSERKRQAPVGLDQSIAAGLASAARSLGIETVSMVSGAAHDTMRLAPHVPAGMLFIPCREGVSHSPEEHADAEDAALAVEVLLSWLVARKRQSKMDQSRMSTRSG